MKKIYVVVSGEYSDFGINAIFTTKELAELYISAFSQKDRYEELIIQEWNIDPYELELKQNRKPFRIIMDKEGNTINIDYETSDFSLMPERLIEFQWGTKNMICRCFADNKKHAVKIANEKRVQILAINKWGESKLNI